MSAQSFSIGFGNRVDITQPAASSVLMMNVVGNNPSNIFGTLTANGQFFLTNSAGVLFGPTAQRQRRRPRRQLDADQLRRCDLRPLRIHQQRQFRRRHRPGGRARSPR